MLTKHTEGGKHQLSNYRSERRLNKMAVRRGDDLPIRESMKCKRRTGCYNYEQTYLGAATWYKWLRSWVGQPWNRVHSELVYRVGFGSERYLNAISNINSLWFLNGFWIDDNDCLQFTPRTRVRSKFPKTEVLAIGKRRFWLNGKLWFELLMGKWIEPVYAFVLVGRIHDEAMYTKVQVSGSRDVFVYGQARTGEWRSPRGSRDRTWSEAHAMQRKFLYGDPGIYCWGMKQCNKKDLKLIRSHHG